MPDLDCAVIAAAGMGTRIGLGMPKCMIEIAGKTLLTRLIEGLRPHVRTIYVAVGYREDMVIDFCARHHRDVVLVRNPEYRDTNTATSAAKCVRHTRGKVMTLSGVYSVRVSKKRKPQFNSARLPFSRKSKPCLAESV